MARMVLLCGVWFEMRNVVEGQGRARYCVVWKFVGVVVRGGALRKIVSCRERPLCRRCLPAGVWVVGTPAE